MPAIAASQPCIPHKLAVWFASYIVCLLAFRCLQSQGRRHGLLLQERDFCSLALFRRKSWPLQERDYCHLAVFSNNMRTGLP